MLAAAVVLRMSSVDATAEPWTITGCEVEVQSATGLHGAQTRRMGVALGRRLVDGAAAREDPRDLDVRRESGLALRVDERLLTTWAPGYRSVWPTRARPHRTGPTDSQRVSQHRQHLARVAFGQPRPGRWPRRRAAAAGGSQPGGQRAGDPPVISVAVTGADQADLHDGCGGAVSGGAPGSRLNASGSRQLAGAEAARRPGYRRHGMTAARRVRASCPAPPRRTADRCHR